MTKVKPRTLSGFMELLPEDQIKLERMTQILRDTYSLFAFTPLDTPVIESAEVLLAKRGDRETDLPFSERRQRSCAAL